MRAVVIPLSMLKSDVSTPGTATPYGMADGPDFFLIGAPKAATTALARWFEDHPETFVPKIKEPHHFSYPEVTDTYYPVQPIGERRQYLALYASRTESRAGDFSTSYLYRSAAANRIRTYDPHAQILVVLRNPIDRALSHHRMDVRDGLTSASFLDVIDGRTESRFRREYLDVGRYTPQLDVWSSVFPPDQMHIVLYDDLIDDPIQTLDKMCEFLGVTRLSVPLRSRRNVSGGRRHPAVRRVASSALSQRAPDALRRRIGSILTPAPEAVAEPALAALRLHFAEEIEALSDRLDRDLSHWIQGP